MHTTNISCFPSGAPWHFVHEDGGDFVDCLLVVGNDDILRRFTISSDDDDGGDDDDGCGRDEWRRFVWGDGSNGILIFYKFEIIKTKIQKRNIK